MIFKKKLSTNNLQNDSLCTKNWLIKAAPTGQSWLRFVLLNIFVLLPQQRFWGNSWMTPVGFTAAWISRK